MADESQGMSLKLVAAISISLIAFLLWGGAAAIYKSHQDHLAAEAEAKRQLEEDGGVKDPGRMMSSGTPGIKFRRGGGLAAAIVVTIMGVWMFLQNSITQLGHLPSVVSLVVTERQGYLIFCFIVLALSAMAFLWMGKVQQSLASGSPFKTDRKRKKLPKIRTPKPTDL